jgi:hypothetical protein
VLVVFVKNLPQNAIQEVDHEILLQVTVAEGQTTPKTLKILLSFNVKK